MSNLKSSKSKCFKKDSNVVNWYDARVVQILNDHIVNKKHPTETLEVIQKITGASTTARILQQRARRHREYLKKCGIPDVTAYLEAQMQSTDVIDEAAVIEEPRENSPLSTPPCTSVRDPTTVPTLQPQITENYSPWDAALSDGDGLGHHYPGHFDDMNYRNLDDEGSVVHGYSPQLLELEPVKDWKWPATADASAYGSGLGEYCPKEDDVKLEHRWDGTGDERETIFDREAPENLVDEGRFDEEAEARLEENLKMLNSSRDNMYPGMCDDEEQDEAQDVTLSDSSSSTETASGQHIEAQQEDQGLQSSAARMVNSTTAAPFDPHELHTTVSKLKADTQKAAELLAIHLNSAELPETDFYSKFFVFLIDIGKVGAYYTLALPRATITETQQTIADYVKWIKAASCSLQMLAPMPIIRLNSAEYGRFLQVCQDLITHIENAVAEYSKYLTENPEVEKSQMFSATISLYFCALGQLSESLSNN